MTKDSDSTAFGRCLALIAPAGLQWRELSKSIYPAAYRACTTTPQLEAFEGVEAAT